MTTEPTNDEQYPGLNEAVAQAVREALAAGAMAAPLEAPPAIDLTMAITPKLGLKQPALDDPALITDLNDNMTILDSAVTATSVATLTNKTLTAPIITNPTITGWTNAQHSHVGAAGGGSLDGGAIVSGDIGTGFVVRETYVQDYLNTGPDLVDAVVRDTLWWGPVGAGAEDVSLKRTAGAEGQLLLQAPRARYAAQAATATSVSRFGQEYAGSGAIMSDNLRTLAGAGGVGWVRDDVTRGGLSLSLNGDTMSLLCAHAGANPVATWITRWSMDAAGTLTLTPDAVGLAINAVGTVRVQGNNLQIGPGGNNPGQGGRVFYNNDAGTLHWSSGLLAVPSARDFVIYDLIRSAQVFTISTTTGTLSLAPAAGALALASGPFSLGTWQGVDANSLRITATTHVSVDPQSNYFLPARTGINCGSGSNSWGTVYAQTGTIQPSSITVKQDIAPLDPVACAQAVLDTDWVSFSYLPPAYIEPPETENQAPEDRQRRVDEGRVAHAKMLVETQPARDQKGYVLGSPDHQTHDLFGLSDRKSASPSTDLAVVACALQQALQRIASLEDEVAALAAQA